MNLLKTITLVTTALLTVSCTTINPYTGDSQTSKATKGALIGIGVEVLAGVISGDDSRERRKHALRGAGIGAIVGGGVGYYMDVQEAELRKELADTGIVFERQGDNIVMSMQGNVTFATGRSNINPQFGPILSRLAEVLKKRNQTLIEVAGHTDSTGSDRINLPLSRDRANSVADYLRNQGVNSSRFAEMGMGADYPIGSNATSEGRQLNRRVEITLVPIT